MKFFTKEKYNVSNRGQSNYADIQRIKNYQLALIDLICYSTGIAGGCYVPKTDRFMQEVKRCEVWLKTATENFMNNNSKHFEL